MKYLLAVFLIAGTFWLSATYLRTHATVANAQTPAAATLPPGAFDATGVVVEYDQNGTMVPYFAYETPKSLATKVLVPPDGSSLDALRLSPGREARIEGMADGDLLHVERVFPPSAMAPLALADAALHETSHALGLSFTPETTNQKSTQVEASDGTATTSLSLVPGTLNAVGAHTLILTAPPSCGISECSLFFAVFKNP